MRRLAANLLPIYDLVYDDRHAVWRLFFHRHQDDQLASEPDGRARFAKRPAASDRHSLVGKLAWHPLWRNHAKHQCGYLHRDQYGDRQPGASARSITESLDFTLLSLLDEIRSEDGQDCEIFLQMTADISGVMEHVRQDFLARGHELSPQLHEVLFSLTSLFERIVWLLRQYCGLVQLKLA